MQVSFVGAHQRDTGPRRRPEIDVRSYPLMMVKSRQSRDSARMRADA
jgi:hypothetical protein